MGSRGGHRTAARCTGPGGRDRRCRSRCWRRGAVEQVVETVVGLPGVAGSREVERAGVEHDGGRQRQPFVARSQDQRARQVRARRRTTHDDLLGTALLQEQLVRREAIVQRSRERMVGRHPVVHRPRARPQLARRADRGHLAQVATTEHPCSTVDVEVDAAIVVAHTLGREHVHRAGPDVALLDRAGVARRGITDHRLHEAVGLGDVRLPSRHVVERRILARRRAEPTHRQRGLRLWAHRRGDRDVARGRCTIGVAPSDRVRRVSIAASDGRDVALPSAPRRVTRWSRRRC